jgi:hypothetical protein
VYEVSKHPTFRVDTPPILKDIKICMIEEGVEFLIYKLGE